MKRGKKAQQLLGEHTLNIVIAVLCIIILIYLGVKVYGIFIPDKEEISNGEILEINGEIEFLIGEEIHHIKLISISDKKALFSIQSDAIEVELTEGEWVKVDVDKDGFYDLNLRLIETDLENNRVIVEKAEINEKIVPTLDKYEQVIFVNQEEALKNKIEVFEEEYVKSAEEQPEVENATKNELVENSLHPEWVEKLSEIPEKPDMPYVKYDWEDGVACGPTAVYNAFHQFGEEVNINEINRKKSTFSGNILRGFLGIFSEEAKLITWPWEIKKIGESFDYEVEVYSGEEATKQLIIDKVGKDSAVLYRSYIHEISSKGDVDPKTMTTIFGIKEQHYTYFDYEKYLAGGFSGEVVRKGFDQLPDDSLKEVYVIKKVA